MCDSIHTDDLQLHKITSDGLCVDLTLISPCIPLLYVLDLKDPFILAGIVNGSEAQVRSVSVTSDGQNVQIMMSDPRNLYRKAVIRKLLFLHRAAKTQFSRLVLHSIFSH